MKYLYQSVSPHFQKLKSSGIIKKEHHFMSLNSEQTRFMMKELRREQARQTVVEREESMYVRVVYSSSGWKIPLPLCQFEKLPQGMHYEITNIFFFFPSSFFSSSFSFFLPLSFLFLYLSLLFHPLPLFSVCFENLPQPFEKLWRIYTPDVCMYNFLYISKSLLN